MFSIPASRVEPAIFVGPANATTEWHTWHVPPGVSMLHILCIGGGGGGGGGFTRIAGAAGGGGGGGGSANVTSLVIPTAVLPDVLYIQPGASGAGGAAGGSGTNGGVSYVAITPAVGNLNLVSEALNGGGASGGASGSAGSNGAAAGAVAYTSMAFACLGPFSSTAGQAGTVGGSQAGAVGPSIALGSTAVIATGERAGQELRARTSTVERSPPLRRSLATCAPWPLPGTAPAACSSGSPYSASAGAAVGLTTARPGALAAPGLTALAGVGAALEQQGGVGEQAVPDSL
jgi:hypothetical protein